MVAGSLDLTDWQDWLRTAMHAGLAGCFDVLSAHPYAGMAVLQEIRALAREEGRPNLQIWVTEFGESTCDDLALGCVTEDEQAVRLVASLRELASDYPYVPVAMIYEAQDDPQALGDFSERHFGLFRTIVNGKGLVPKPTVAAIHTLYQGH